MVITQERFVAINKYALIAAIIIYLVGVFTPLKVLQPGIIFTFWAGFFLLLHQPYFLSRVKLAAHLWLVPAFIGALTYPALIEKEASGQNLTHLVLVLLISLLPFLLLITGTTEAAHSKKSRLKIVSARTVVQTFIFMVWATVTAFAFIKGSRGDLLFWGMFHVFTVAIFPFLIGRVLCGWLCPNATMQDALYKNLTFKRPIENLPRAIEEQSHSSAMYVSGQIDKNAPYLPFTLLLCWFPMFFSETVFDLTGVMWYPVAFMYGLIGLSLFMPWRKVCTHFCWLSSYRAMCGHGSLWRLRYNKSLCKECKICKAEEACPFFIDIRNQDNEMPASCCLCFSCMEACPFKGVISFRRAPEEKARVKALGKAA
jgi:polyferredoxin